MGIIPKTNSTVASFPPLNILSQLKQIKININSLYHLLSFYYMPHSAKVLLYIITFNP